MASEHDRRRHARWRAESGRALAYLRDLIEDSDLRQRDVEDRLGWRRGQLSQILNGHVELRTGQLELLLDALAVDPAGFFRELYPRPRRRQARHRRAAPELKVTKDVISVYGCGIDELRDLRRRLERCEEAIEAATESDALSVPESTDRRDVRG